MQKKDKQRINNILLIMERIHTCLEKQCLDIAILDEMKEVVRLLNGYVEDEQFEVLINNYCDSLTKLSQSSVGHKQLEQLIKHCNSSFEKLKKELEKTLQVKQNIVFFPYNASMWDSLESVWKAAVADDNCDVKVVPIPYFERTPDGACGEMHYEGNLLPDYVPIVNWQDYDLEEERADIAYIHNPYDEYNRVTSVYPDFYSKRIRKYVDKLVYIPYYLFVNDMVREEMVWVPGVINADYVICQSEECCDKSIEIYDKKCKEINRSADGKQKFLPLGSPIVDKINQANVEELPIEWKKLICCGDRKKKVLFYNTHLSSVMGDNAEKFFKKIQYVFDFVRQQEDVVLLWRPHPLMRATIHSMNPVVAVKYDELVEQYKSTGWGIYDETADLNRSIAISDMYYGDWSSVATMFQEAGKPVMLESLYVTQKKDLNNFWAGNILVEEEGIWLVMGSCNSLFYYDKRDNSLQFKAKIEEEQGVSLYHKIVRYKDSLFFVPFAAKNIAVYNTKKDTISYIEVKDGEQHPCKFYDAIQIEDRYLYMFPTVYPQGIKLDMETQKIEYISLSSLYEIVKRSKDEVLFFASFLKRKNSIYMLLSESGQIVTYDTNKKTFEMQSLSLKEDKFITMCDMKENIMAISKNSKEIRILSPTDGKIETHKVDYSAVSHEALDCIFSNREHGCVGSICRQKELFLIPDLGNYIIKVSLESFQAEEVKINEENEKNASGINSKVLLYENNIYCHMQCHNGIVCINSENEADVLDTKLSLDFYEKNYNLSNEIGKIIVEDGYCYDFRDLCKLKHGQEEIGNEINHGVLIHTEITRK